MLASVAVGLAVLIAAAPRGWRCVVISELKAAGLVFVLLAISYGSGRFIDWRSAKVAQAIAQAKAAEANWGPPGEDEQIARRAVRTIVSAA